LRCNLKGRARRKCSSHLCFVIGECSARFHTSCLAGCFKLLVRKAWPGFFAAHEKQWEREGKRCLSKWHCHTFFFED